MIRPGDEANTQRDSNGTEASHHALVRPYMLTRGRTSSSLGVFELHAPESMFCVKNRWRFQKKIAKQ